MVDYIRYDAGAGGVPVLSVSRLRWDASVWEQQGQ